MAENVEDADDTFVDACENEQLIIDAGLDDFFEQLNLSNDAVDECVALFEEYNDICADAT